MPTVRLISTAAHTPAAPAALRVGPSSQNTQPIAGNGTRATSGDGGSASVAGFLTLLAVNVNAAGGLYVLQQDSVRFVDGSQTVFNFGSVAAGVTSGTLPATVANLDIVNLPSPTNPPWSALPMQVYGGFLPQVLPGVSSYTVIFLQQNLSLLL